MAKVKQPRNRHAISAHFRKAGPMKDKRKGIDWRKEVFDGTKPDKGEILEIECHIDNMLTEDELDAYGITPELETNMKVFRVLCALNDMKSKYLALLGELNA